MWEIFLKSLMHGTIFFLNVTNNQSINKTSDTVRRLWVNLKMFKWYFTPKSKRNYILHKEMYACFYNFFIVTIFIFVSDLIFYACKLFLLLLCNTKEFTFCIKKKSFLELGFFNIVIFFLTFILDIYYYYLTHGHYFFKSHFPTKFSLLQSKNFGVV